MLITSLYENSNTYTVSWAIDENVVHGTRPYKNRIVNGTFDEASIVWVNIEDIFKRTEKDFTLDVTSPDGGVNSIGNRVDKAKAFFSSGYMNPSELGVSQNGKSIVFDDGRHRLVAAYQLGARFAPVIVMNGSISKVSELVRTQGQPESFAHMKEILSNER